jgi:hypothetical protein
MKVDHFKILLWAIFVLAALILLTRFQEIYMTAAIFIIIFGNKLIGDLLTGFHRNLQTEDPRRGVGRSVREVAALLETFLFSLLLATGQTIIFAGYLISKCLGFLWRATVPSSSLVAAEAGREVALFRVGLALQLVLALAASALFSRSELFRATVASWFSFLGI